MQIKGDDKSGSDEKKAGKSKWAGKAKKWMKRKGKMMAQIKALMQIEDRDEFIAALDGKREEVEEKMGKWCDKKMKWGKKYCLKKNENNEEECDEILEFYEDRCEADMECKMVAMKNKMICMWDEKNANEGEDWDWMSGMKVCWKKQMEPMKACKAEAKADFDAATAEAGHTDLPSDEEIHKAFMATMGKRWAMKKKWGNKKKNAMKKWRSRWNKKNEGADKENSDWAEKKAKFMAKLKERKAQWMAKMKERRAAKAAAQKEGGEK